MFLLSLTTTPPNCNNDKLHRSIQQFAQQKEDPSYTHNNTLKILEKMRGDGGEDKSLELLRSQDRVVSMLYHKTFPVPVRGGGGPSAAELEELKVTPEDVQDVLLRPHPPNELPSIAGGGALSVGSADGSANAGAGAGGRPTTGPTIGS
jgi:hypothetical protein